jgi:hypothetical protein
MAAGAFLLLAALVAGARATRDAPAARAAQAAADAKAAAVVKSAPGGATRRHPIPYAAYDRTPMAGKAKGQRAGGQPDPVPGLASPDAPVLTSKKTASMEGAAAARATACAARRTFVCWAAA